MTEANLVRRGIALPTVGNPAAANHILKGYEVVTADGELLVGTLSGTNGLANYAGFPSITASNWMLTAVAGGGTVSSYTNVSSEFANAKGFITGVSGTTLTTYFALRTTTTGSPGVLSVAPHGGLQFNPFNKTCRVTTIGGWDSCVWSYTVISATFSRTSMTATVSARATINGYDAATVTLVLSKSYSAVQTINIPSNL